MRRTIQILTTGLLVLALASPTFAGRKSWWGGGEKGSDDLKTEPREVDEFTRVSLAGSFKVEITVGEAQSVELTFDDNLLDNIVTEVRRGELLLETEDSFSSRKPCFVKITVPSLEGVYCSGSGDIRIDNVSSDEFECHISGSGDITASGRCKELELAITGSGDIDTRDLRAEDVHARISGSGDMDVYAANSIRGSVSGSGDINYYGDPPSTRVRVSGSGEIRPR